MKSIIFEDAYKNVDLYDNMVETIKKNMLNDTNSFMYKSRLPIFMKVDSVDKTIELGDVLNNGIDTIKIDDLIADADDNGLIIVCAVLEPTEAYTIDAPFIASRLKYCTIKNRSLYDVINNVSVDNKNIVVLYSVNKLVNSNIYHVMINNNVTRLANTDISSLTIDDYFFNYLSGYKEDILTTAYPVTVKNALSIIGNTIVVQKGTYITIDTMTLPVGEENGVIRNLGTEKINSNFDVTNDTGKYSFTPSFNGYFTVEFDNIPFGSNIEYFGYKFLIQVV
jgi:hypothetical protein